MKTLLLPTTLFCCSLAFTINIYSQSISLSKSVYMPGEKIIITFSGFAGNSRDWIGIAQPGSADDKYIVWQYTNGTPSGTLTFDGLAYGDYEVRGYYNNEGIVRFRQSFKVGNVNNNLVVKTDKPNYVKNEKIMVQYSGLPGNGRDWISLAAVGSADDKYVRWFYTEGKQAGTFEFPGLDEGNYEVRVYFNNEGTIRLRYPFTVGRTSSGTKICRTELSTFYAAMNSLGLCWGRLGSDAIIPATISAVQAELGNVIAGINIIPCLNFDVNRIRDFSSRLPSLSRQQAVDEIDRLIKDLLGAVQKANITCDRGATLESLYITGVHMGAAQAIANTFICRMIPADWQSNLSNHLATARNAIVNFNACIPTFNPAVFSTVPVGASNAYEPLSVIIGIHIQILWAVSLTDCCCYCK